jgi:hypothetical protein
VILIAVRARIQLRMRAASDTCEKRRLLTTAELIGNEDGIQLRLTHAGFPDKESRDGHEKAWHVVLEQLDQGMTTILT